MRNSAAWGWTRERTAERGEERDTYVSQSLFQYLSLGFVTLIAICIVSFSLVADGFCADSGQQRHAKCTASDKRVSAVC